MSGGRPRTAIGTYGAVYVMNTGDRCVAETRFRDADGRLRKVTATAGSPSAARALLKERLLNRPGYGSGGALSLASPFGDLAALWLADLDLRELASTTKQSYRDQLRLHVLPAFEHYSLGEISPGYLETWLRDVLNQHTAPLPLPRYQLPRYQIPKARTIGPGLLVFLR